MQFIYIVFPLNVSLIMIPYQKEKLENAVCFFAQEHYKKTRHRLYQTFLYKYLALFDFGHLKAYGKPALGLTYKAMKMGPVPVDLYERRDDPDWSTHFSFRKDENQNVMVVPKGSPDLDYFSRREIELMQRLIEIYGQGYVTTRIMSNASHLEILAWQRTFACQENAVIDFSLEFPGDVLTKPEHELTFPEEVYLVQKGLETCI